MGDGGRGGKRGGDWGGRGGGGKKGRWHRPSSSSAVIPYGVPGVMVTCEQGKERAACRDVARALDEAYELWFPDKDKQDAKGDAAKDDANPSETTKKPSSDDPSDLLAAELKQLKETKSESKRFTYVNLDFKACAFVSMAKGIAGKVAMSDLVHDVLQRVAAGDDTKEDDDSNKMQSLVPKSRYALRLVPADDVCFAGIEEIKKSVRKMIEGKFPVLEGKNDAFKEKNKKKFAVSFGSRANNSLRRMEIIEAVAELVPVGHKVDLTDPDLTITVEVIKGTVCVSILKNYFKLHKYNWRFCGLTEEERTAERAKNLTPNPAKE